MYWVKCFVLVVLLFQALKGTSSLKCYSCINLQCPESRPFICDQAKPYIFQRLREIYSSYEHRTEIPICPSPEDAEGWSTLKSESSNSRPCKGNKKDEALCAVGRFKVTTTILETKRNVIFYGTSLGCTNKTQIDSRTGFPNEPCGLQRSRSARGGKFQHFLEIENCAGGERCQNEDFCIETSKSIVKKWRDDLYEDSSSKGPIATILWAIIVIAVILFVLFLVGIKYDVILRFFFS